MPPTLGRLVPCVDNVVSRECSPMKPVNGNVTGVVSGNVNANSGNIGRHAISLQSGGGNRREVDGGGMQGTDLSQAVERVLATYGRSQDDLNLTPHAHGHYGSSNAGGVMGMELLSSGGVGAWGSGSGMNDQYQSGFYVNRMGRNNPGPTEFFGGVNSNGNDNTTTPRPLQHMHSRDDIDALRPRKTRRMGPSFNSPIPPNHGQDPAKSFLAISPRRDRDRERGDRVGLGLGLRGAEGRSGYVDSTGVYTSPDEVPPAAPRRLVSRHNTPSRPERSGAKNSSISNNKSNSNSNINSNRSSSVGRGGIDDSEERRAGGSGGGGRGRMVMSLADPNLMDTSGGSISGVGSLPNGMGGMSMNQQGYQLAQHGFHAAVSPVVAPGHKGFAGGRRHDHERPHPGAKTQHGSGPGWRMGEVSPEELAVMRGDSPSSPSSSRSGGGGGGGMGGLGLTAHAMSRMKQVCTWQYLMFNVGWPVFNFYTPYNIFILVSTWHQALCFEITCTISRT